MHNSKIKRNVGLHQKENSALWKKSNMKINRNEKTIDWEKIFWKHRVDERLREYKEFGKHNLKIWTDTS